MVCKVIVEGYMVVTNFQFLEGLLKRHFNVYTGHRSVVLPQIEHTF